MTNLLFSYLYFYVFSGVESPAKRWQKVLSVIVYKLKTTQCSMTFPNTRKLRGKKNCNKDIYSVAVSCFFFNTPAVQTFVYIYLGLFFSARGMSYNRETKQKNKIQKTVSNT